MECARCVVESEWHAYEAIQIMMEGKCSLIFVCIIILDLSISAISVKRCKDGLFAEQVYEFVYARYPV